MPNLSFYERQHLEKLIQQESALKYIFDEYVRNISILMSGWQDSGNENVWIRNAHIEKGVEKELQVLHDKLLVNIEKYSIDAWNRSNRKTDDLIEGYIKDIPLNNVARKGLFVRNEEALQSFLKSKIDGETISDRVWNITGGGKEAIEHYLSSGISTGRPATVISQDIRQLLNNPDKRFRRIRNEEGKLVMSAPMKDYHPGTGVYRSSFMNAKRLAVSQTNAAYRTADCDRWEKLDFVLGFDVRRSASNKGPCPVCDALVGRYPKDYKFRGWHPFCICVATPILMDEDAFIDSLVDDDFSNVKYVESIPENSKEYFQKLLNEKKINSKSYQLKKNSKYFDERIDVKGNGTLKILQGVDKKASDYKNVFACAQAFAENGNQVEILPRIHPKDRRYKEVYGKLTGTKFEGKSPDLLIDGKYYEHEGFKTRNPKNALHNMLHKGSNQSDRIIIEDCGHQEWYYKQRIHLFLMGNKNIVLNEVWLFKENELILLLKNAEAR